MPQENEFDSLPTIQIDWDSKPEKVTLNPFIAEEIPSSNQNLIDFNARYQFFLQKQHKDSHFLAFLHAIPACLDENNHLIQFNEKDKKIFDHFLFKVIGTDPITPCCKHIAFMQHFILTQEAREKYINVLIDIGSNYQKYGINDSPNIIPSQALIQALFKSYPHQPDKYVIDGIALLNEFRNEKMSKINRKLDQFDIVATEIDPLHLGKRFAYREEIRSVQSFYAKGIDLLLSKKSKHEIEKQFKQLATKEFHHPNMGRRLLADALLLISVMFAGIGLCYGLYRISENKNFFFTLTKTKRERDFHHHASRYGFNQ